MLLSVNTLPLPAEVRTYIPAGIARGVIFANFLHFFIEVPAFCMYNERKGGSACGI